ncbi:hypothetical protein G9A89_010144 [Geosiphon pyriformis]|nr:hypothetical protein G9A89_010144 [Geosiphon pyriformis]
MINQNRSLIMRLLLALGFKAVVSRKKRKKNVLAEGIDNRGVAAKAFGARSWDSKTGDTTESKSIDMEEKCLVKKTSVDYGENEKPLGVIDYGTVNTDNDVLDNFFLLLPPLPIKPTIQVLIHKFFTLNIDLVAIAGKSSQEKLSFIKKIFSSVNGFGGASTPSKFGRIIHVTFTLEKAMMAAGKLANDHGVVVNTNLKHPVNNHTNWAIVMKKIPVGISMETVCATVSEFGLIKSIKIQLNQADFLTSKWSILIGKNTVHMTKTNVNKQIWDFKDEFRALLYTLLVETNAHDLWDFVGSVGGKTCVIDYNPVSYTYARCAIVCFGFESDLVSAMTATPVIKGIGLRWSHLSLALCLVCSLSGHTSLNCVSVKVGSILRGRKAPFSARDQSAPISHPLAFSDKTWASVVGASPVHSSHGADSLLGSDNVGKPLFSVVDDLKKHLVNIESSLISLAGQIGELAKRLDSLVLALSVIFPSQNQGEDIMIEVGSGKTIGDETATVTAMVKDSSVFSHVAKLENMLEGLAASVLSLSACFDRLVLTGSMISQPPSQ